MSTRKSQLSMSELLLGVPEGPLASSSSSSVKGVSERKFFAATTSPLTQPIPESPASPLKPPALLDNNNNNNNNNNARHARARSESGGKRVCLVNPSTGIRAYMDVAPPAQLQPKPGQHRRSTSWLSNIFTNKKKDAAKNAKQRKNNVREVATRVKAYQKELTTARDSYKASLSKLASKQREVMTSLTALIDKTQRHMQLEKLGFLQMCVSLRTEIFESQFAMYRSVLGALNQRIALCRQLLDEISEFAVDGQVWIHVPDDFILFSKQLILRLKDVPVLLAKRKRAEGDLKAAQEQYDIVSKNIDAEEANMDRKQVLHGICEKFHAFICDKGAERPYLAARDVEFLMLKWLCDERHAEGKILARWFARAEAANSDTLNDSNSGRASMSTSAQSSPMPHSRKASIRSTASTDSRRSSSSSTSSMSSLAHRASVLSADVDVESLETRHMDISRFLFQFTSKLLVDYESVVPAAWEETFRLLIERVLFPRAWQLIRELDHVDDAQEQKVYDERVVPLRKVPPSALGVADCFLPCDYEFHATISSSSSSSSSSVKQPHPYATCVSMLEDAMEVLVPSDILACLIACTKKIYATANSYSLDHFGKEKQTTKQDLGADSFFPLFLFVLIHARLPDIVGRLKIIEYYAAQAKKHGEEGYYLATLQSAVSFVTNETHRDLFAHENHEADSQSMLLRMGLVDDLKQPEEEEDVALMSASSAKSRSASVRSAENHKALFETEPETFSTAMDSKNRRSSVAAPATTAPTPEPMVSVAFANAPSRSNSNLGELKEASSSSFPRPGSMPALGSATERPPIKDFSMPVRGRSLFSLGDELSAFPTSINETEATEFTQATVTHSPENSPLQTPVNTSLKVTNLSLSASPATDASNSSPEGPNPVDDFLNNLSW